jgi:hypothetical protein
MGAKEILLKAVIQSIPVFTIGVFKIPKNICKEITDLCRLSSGVTLKNKSVCIGVLGGGCAYRKKREVWASEILIRSI